MTTEPPPKLFPEDGPRTQTAAYTFKAQRKLPPVCDCDRAKLLAIAEQGATGRGYALLASAPHIAAICVDYLEMAKALANAMPAHLVGLHVAAMDHYEHPSQYTGVNLERAAIRMTITKLRDTGEIVPRAALLLLQQLSDDPCRCGSDEPTCDCHVPLAMEAF